MDQEALCQICGLVYQGMKDFNIHYQKVHADFSLDCHVCKKKFMKRIQLWNHFAIHKKTTCPKCSLSFPMNSRSVHKCTNDTFLCSICPYKTGQKGNLKKHEKTCLVKKIKKPKKMYDCTYCKKNI